MTTADDDGVERQSPAYAIYDQYYEHIRHMENEMWAFARIWAIIITGIFTIIGTELPTAAKIGAAFFGALLSMFGFLTVYALRVPFLDYYLTTDLIARNEFRVDVQYRRFSDQPDIRVGKLIEVHELLAAMYIIVTGVMVLSIGTVLGRTIAGMVAGSVLVVLLTAFYIKVIIPEYRQKVGEFVPDSGDD